MMQCVREKETKASLDDLVEVVHFQRQRHDSLIVVQYRPQECEGLVARRSSHLGLVGAAFVMPNLEIGVRVFLLECCSGRTETAAEGG